MNNEILDTPVLNLFRENNVKGDLLTRIITFIGLRVRGKSVNDVTVNEFLEKVPVESFASETRLGPMRAVRVLEIFRSKEIDWK